MGEDEMVGWHHRLDGREFEQAPGDSEGETIRRGLRGVIQAVESQRVGRDLATE